MILRSCPLLVAEADRLRGLIDAENKRLRQVVNQQRKELRRAEKPRSALCERLLTVQRSGGWRPDGS